MSTHAPTDLDPRTAQVIGAAIEVHRALGPGLLESVYQACLEHELRLRDIPFESQVELPVEYKGLMLDKSFVMDLLVYRDVVVELKSVEKLIPVHDAQLLTQMKLARHRTGLLINFNVPVLRDGIRRFAL